ncbi:hypothetical protein BV22DRAFT_877305 [Leucogyrophana mollusca]|uniref:Uncharacterized protein n=1 Tax=Leucogyrophana mollusca TaxID=85980 RepID=A0ACB8B328_9AGAM|nr:hypothetical protein BV22DRAFT_877305 [Leucogyrophana mollusca]
MTSNQALLAALRGKRAGRRGMGPDSASETPSLRTPTPDSVHVRNVGAFVALLDIALCQRRMRIAGHVGVDVIASGRLWTLTVLETPKSKTKGAETWHVVLALLEHSSPTYFDVQLVVKVPIVPLRSRAAPNTTNAPSGPAGAPPRPANAVPGPVHTTLVPAQRGPGPGQMNYAVKRVPRHPVGGTIIVPLRLGKYRLAYKAGKGGRRRGTISVYQCVTMRVWFDLEATKLHTDSYSPLPILHPSLTYSSAKCYPPNRTLPRSSPNAEPGFYPHTAPQPRDVHQGGLTVRAQGRRTWQRVGSV